MTHVRSDWSVLPALAHNAAAEDSGAACIGASVALLRGAGWLGDDGSAAPEAMARRLMRIAGANLSVARLYEGHVNALRLGSLHGDAGLRARLRGIVGDGGLLGVWGADGPDPVRVEGGRLAGAKTFASGLGVVSHAVVMVGGLDQGRIGLVAVDDPARQDAAQWDMPGMRATRSGGYDFAGLPEAAVDWIGPPGCYGTEPGFVTGVWRIAAVQAGATLGLIEAAAASLRARGRLGAEAQIARLAPLLGRALAAEALVRRAACVAEGAAARADPERAVALSASARLLTEAVGQDAIAIVERSVGLGHFVPGSTSGRIARDLAVYMRQAARDALRARVGAHAFGPDASVWDLAG